MADQLQLRGGTTNEHSTFTGALREVTVDTDKDTLIVHDAATAGGHPLLREDGSNSALSLGTAGTPSLKFTGDTNTGIYSPGADQVAVATNGVGRLFVDASGNVGVGTTSPAYPLVVASNITSTLQILSGGSTNQSRLFFADANDIGIGRILYDHNDNSMQLYANNTERLRIDSSGRLLVGTSTSDSQFDSNVQITAAGGSTILLSRYSNNTAGPVLFLAKSRGSSIGTKTIVQSGDETGKIDFRATDGANHYSTARIEAFVDGTPGTNDMPGRLVFSTTADGANTTTERMRINANGNVEIRESSNTVSTGASLYLFDTAGAASSGNSSGRICFYSSDSTDGPSIRSEISNNYENSSADSALLFKTYNGTLAERLRIDSSGRLLVGSSTGGDVNYGGGTGGFHLVGGNADAHLMIRRAGGNGSLTLVRSNGTVAAPTVVANNDVIGQIRFVPYDGTDYTLQCARISAEIDGTPGADDVPGRLVFSTTADGASTPTERMRITNAGFVGIGTASPSSQLHLQSSSPNLRLESTSATGASVIQFGDPNDIDVGSIRYEHTDNALRFIANAAERVRIDSSGRLLAGTFSAINTDSNALIQVASSTGGYYIAARNDTSVSANNVIGGMRFYGNDSDGNYDECARIECVADGTHGDDSKQSRLAFLTTAGGSITPTERMRINKDGVVSTFSDLGVFVARTALAAGKTDVFFSGLHTATSNTAGGTLAFRVWTDGDVVNTNNSYGAISDIKLKENIVDANSQWSDIKALQVRKYNFKEETGQETHTQIGLVAQEAELVSPGLVSESPDRDAEGNDLGTVTKSVNYSVLYMKAVKALQEAMERIETLEGMVAVNNITIDEQQHQLSTLADRLTALESA
jgi:hypothetical protein